MHLTRLMRVRHALKGCFNELEGIVEGHLRIFRDKRPANFR